MALFKIENTEERFAFEHKETGRAPRQLSVIEVGTMANALDSSPARGITNITNMTNQHINHVNRKIHVCRPKINEIKRNYMYTVEI
jgi:N-acyl-L-homoserine lactone synthetase